jgi:hypothetical protein
MDYSQPTEMTTTQMIEFLRQHEHGGATGREREINFWVDNKKYTLISLISTGDGLVTDISIQLEQPNG